MKRVLITGASGFIGGFLAEQLLKLGGYEIHGTYLVDGSQNTSPVKDIITFHKVDLMDRSQIDIVMDQVKPEYVYHLAAASSVGASFKDPIGTFHANIDAEVNLLESLRSHSLTNTRVLIFSSAEVYGYVTPQDLPVDESTPLRPASPYAVSKITQDYLGYQYFINYQMPIIRVRPYNQIGPRQGPGFVTSDFAKQIAQIEKGQIAPVIKVGNLDAKRDFTDVRDMVRLYPLLLEKGIPGEVYNVGSGKSRKIHELVDLLIKQSNVEITIEVDESRLRPSDVPEVFCNITKIGTLTGWKPEIELENTLKDILDYWRNII